MHRRDDNRRCDARRKRCCSWRRDGGTRGIDGREKATRGRVTVGGIATPPLPTLAGEADLDFLQFAAGAEAGAFESREGLILAFPGLSAIPGVANIERNCALALRW